MDQTWIENMQVLKSRLDAEMNDLKSYLDDLTQDGSGVLYDMRTVVGDSGEIGSSLGQIGGVVMDAKQKLFVSLQKISDLIAQKIADAQQYNEESISNQQKVASVLNQFLGNHNLTFIYSIANNK